MPASSSCSLSYLSWRDQVIRQLLQDTKARYGSSGERLPFLHPKTLHERRWTTKRHLSTTTKDRSRKSGARHKEGDVQKGRLRYASPQNGSQSTTQPESMTEQKQPSSDSAQSAPWRPMSGEGQRDLQALAESMRRMLSTLKSTSDDPPVQMKDAEQTFMTSPLETRVSVGKDRNPKRQPTKAEKGKLASNPWATMLAGPLRTDAASKARFPAPLLLDVGHVKNPGDGTPYVMPDTLADLMAFQQRLNNGQASAAMKRSLDGKRPRLLPYKLLMEDLSGSFASKTGRPKKGAVLHRLYPHRVREAADKAAAYDGASKDYWDLRERQGELDNDLFKRPEEKFDMRQLQWEASIVDRISNIMRQRVLLALDFIVTKQNMPRDKERRLFYSFDWPGGRHSHLIGEAFRDSISRQATPASGSQTTDCSELAARQDHWNDMGDIETPNAITGTNSQKNRSMRDDSRPPIAVQPHEIPQESGQSDKSRQLDNKDDPGFWLPGSFILHFGPAHTALSALPYLEHDTASIQDLIDGDNPTFDHSKYIPPMLDIAGTHRLPVFSVSAMLGRHFYPLLATLLKKHKKMLHVIGEQIDDMNQVVLVKSVSPGGHFLAQELWQLWRYLGGRDCLIGSARKIGTGRVRYAPGAEAESESKPELLVPPKFRRLSDQAWEHIHELLGLTKYKKEAVEQDRSHAFQHSELGHAPE